MAQNENKTKIDVAIGDRVSWMAVNGRESGTIVGFCPQGIIVETRRKMFVLANGEWNTEELEDWGMELDYIEGGTSEWDEMDDPDAGGKKDGGEDESMYSRKIQPPVYEITGAEPTIAECIDMTPVKKLLAEIDASGVSEEQKEMLRACAYRHAVIHFDQMAEYYAHQKAEMQDLMENNALVIIDYDKALERGFVEMTSRLQHLIPDAEEGETLDESEIEVVDADRYENDETYSEEE